MVHTQFRVIIESCLLFIDPNNFIGVLSCASLSHSCLGLVHVSLPLLDVFTYSKSFQCPLEQS